LSDESARQPTFGVHSSLYIPDREVAVKTGTTNNNKDAWTIGYTPSLVVGVWAGNNDNTPMKKGGAALAGPIWNNFMSAALENMPNEDFEKPDLTVDPTLKPILRGFWQGNETYLVDKISGKLATADTPKETVEERPVTNVHSILYWVDRDDILGPPPSHPESNPQFLHWEIPVQRWWSENKYRYPTAYQPTSSDDVHTDSSAPVVTILQPNSQAVYPADQAINLTISSSGPFPLQKIDIFVNGDYLGTDQPPFNYSFAPAGLKNLQNVNEIKIIAYDSAYNHSEAVSTFRVE